MRIVVDARLLSAPRAGSAYYLLHLLDALARRPAPHEYLLLVTATEVGGLIDSPGRFGFVVCPDLLLGDAIGEQVRLPRLLEELSPDLYVSPALSLPLVRVCRQAMIVHDLGFESHPEFYPPGLRAHFKRWVRPSVGCADAVVTISEFSRAEIANTYGYPAERIAVIPGAADGRFRPEVEAGEVQTLREKLGLRAPFVLTVGGLEANKNHARLVEAWASLDQQLRERWRLVLAGRPGGAWTQVQQTIGRHGLGDEVRLLGPVADEDLPLLYHAADLFAFPSLYEGFGLPPLEAMACGLPVVASGAAALPEAVGEAALLVEPEDTASLAAGLARAMRDEGLRQELSRAGLERVRCFSWERSADLFLQVCDRAVAADMVRSV